MIVVGIDPSINCTGVCLYSKSINVNHYYLIPSKMTKKMDEFKHDCICILPYTKHGSRDDEYSEKEKNKTINIYSICRRIRRIIEQIQEIDTDITVNMEGVSYGSVGGAALVDLSGLNFAIRMTLFDMKIPFNIISPTSVKKFAVANGQAEKDIMIDAWKRLDKNISNVTSIKIDDLADSYFLAHYKNTP